MEALILERLRLCDLQIEGVRRAWDVAPSEAIPVVDLPCVYGLVGPTTPAPGALGSSRSVEVQRAFIRRLLLLPFATGVDDVENGAEAIQIALPFFRRVATYHLQYPQLATPTLAKLAGVKMVLLSDSGVVQRVGPGGGNYSAIDFTYIITYHYNVGARSVPYAT